MRLVIVGVKWALVVIWMLFIFTMSATPVEQSWELSGKVADKVIIVEQPTTIDSQEVDRSNHFRDTINIIVRKCAHIFEYFILCLLLIIALLEVKGVNKKVLLIAGCITLLYATLDEMHQLMVPGRSGTFHDVLIDSMGILVAILFYKISLRLLHKYKLRVNR